MIQFLDDWSPAAIVASNTALLALLNAGSGAASVEIRDNDELLLATISLSTPIGSIDSLTGTITVTTPAMIESATNGGIAAFATLLDGDGVAHRSIPCVTGASSVVGYCVLSSLLIVYTRPVEITSMVIL